MFVGVLISSNLSLVNDNETNHFFNPLSWLLTYGSANQLLWFNCWYWLWTQQTYAAKLFEVHNINRVFVTCCSTISIHFVMKTQEANQQN